MSIKIVMTSLYKSQEAIRYHLACQTIGNAIALGYDVLIVDKSPNPEISRSFRRIGADVHNSSAKTFGEQKRELFGICVDRFNESDVLVAMEPEKVDLVRLIPSIIAPIEQGQADIVMPKRTEESWSSYPDFQVTAEKETNAAFSQATGKKGFDIPFGAVALSCKMAQYFAACNPTQFDALDKHVQIYASIIAIANGHRVISVPVNFFYPATQKREEETTLRKDMITLRKTRVQQHSYSFRVAAKVLKWQ